MRSIRLLLKSITNSALLLIGIVLSIFGVTFAQYVTNIPVVPFSQTTNNTFLSAAQCVDGGKTNYDNRRLYYSPISSLNDSRYPVDYYTKASSSRYIDWIRLDSGKTNIVLHNPGIFNVNGDFKTKSYGNPLDNGGKVLRVGNNSGMSLINHPSSPLSIASQLVYSLWIDAFDKNTNGSFNVPAFYYYNTATSSYVLNPAVNNINRNYQDTAPGIECQNFYVSRCGDGYIDVSGQQPINGSTTLPYPLQSGSVTEQCDPGANLSSYTDDIMPNGATPTVNYNCTSSCTIINNPQPPILVYTKTVRNVTTNSNNGQFVEADSQGAAVVIHTGDTVQYQITITKTGGPVTNTILSDVLPTNNGFLLSAYSINGGSQTSATSFPATNITSLLNAGPVTVTLYGVVGSPTATAFVNTATLTENGIAAGTLSPGSNVAWTVLENITPPKPDVSIKKEVEVTPNSNTRQELSTVTPGQTVRFKITYKNISSVNALNALITDTLPAGLTCVSAVHQDGAAIPCVSNGISWTEPVMNPGVEKYIIITANVAATISSGVTTNTANIQLPGGPVKSDPAQVQPQSITDFVVTKKILSGSVIPGTIIKYEIGFKNIGNAPISSYTLTDPLQNSTYVAGSSRLNGSISITPSYIGNTLTRGCNSTNTALNGQIVCPLQPGANGTIVFDVLVN